MAVVNFYLSYLVINIVIVCFHFHIAFLALDEG